MLWTEFFIFRKPFALNLRGVNIAWFHTCFLAGYPIVSCKWIFYHVFLLVIRFWVWWTGARARTTWAWNIIFFFLTSHGVNWDFKLWSWCLRCHKFTILIAIKSTPRTVFHCLSWVLSFVNRKSPAEVVNIIIKACEALALNILLTLFFRLPLDYNILLNLDPKGLILITEILWPGWTPLTWQHENLERPNFFLPSLTYIDLRMVLFSKLMLDVPFFNFSLFIVIALRSWPESHFFVTVFVWVFWVPWVTIELRLVFDCLILQDV